MIYCLRNENPLGALLIKFSKDDSSTANCAEFKKKIQQALTDGITIVLGDQVSETTIFLNIKVIKSNAKLYNNWS